jgi:hypothetical protein
MDRQNYMTRALQSRDPRFAQILGKLGYETREQAPKEAKAPAPKADGIAELRKEYERVVGKKPFNGWDAKTLGEKIEAHQAS